MQIGWVFHYWVAIVYGYCYYFLLAVDILDTSILSGLIFGLISVIVPWFFYLPVTGKGFMGNKTPNPTLTKLLSTSSHVVVGIFLAIGFSFLGYWGLNRCFRIWSLNQIKSYQKFLYLPYFCCRFLSVYNRHYGAAET